jgi:hypothetical protein
LYLIHVLSSGRECIIILENHASLLELTFVDKDQETRVRYVSLWKAFKEVFEAIMDVDDDGDLDAQADHVQLLASEFGKQFQECMPGASGGVYLHILVNMHICLFLFAISISNT